MPRRLVFLLALLFVCLGAALWLRQKTADTHDQMVAMLAHVRDRTPAENAYLGNADLLELNERLAGAQSVADRVSVLWERAPVELRLGMTEEALADLKEVQSVLADFGPNLGPEEYEQFEEELYFQLAVASLRKGETENCVHCQTGESCILPIRGSGVHLHATGSREAIKYLGEVLKREPGHLTARWLLNIANMTTGTYPEQVPDEFLIPPSRFESEIPFPRFHNVAGAAGLDTFGLAGGVAVDDFDGDGLLDVVASDWNTSADLRYFHSNGDGTFTDRSQEAGFEGILGGLNLRHADYDNDGDLDLLVLRGGWMNAKTLCINSLLENNGRGIFRDVTFKVGLGDVHYQTQTADWGDFDNDGFLDLYIGNENHPNQLFRNTGKGQFVDVAAQAGVDNPHYTKGVAWGDFDSDGFLDLYVSNLDGPNQLYRNHRDGTFTDVAAQLQVSGPTQSFPTWFWDYNNDGALDIYVGAYDIGKGVEAFVADFLSLPHSADVDHLYQGDGQGGFREVAAEKQLAHVTFPMGSNFGDIDGDGFLDFYLGTGYTEYDALLPNRAFLNRAGERFSDVSMAGGLSHLQKGHGVAITDIDNDGDNDIFIVLGGAYPGDGYTNSLFENPGFDHHWLKIKLIGTVSNRSAIGARIKVVVDDHGEQRTLYRWVNSGGSFGGNPLRQDIGIGKAQKIESIEVSWPTSGTTQNFRNVPIDQCIEITEGEESFQTISLGSFQIPSST